MTFNSETNFLGASGTSSLVWTYGKTINARRKRAEMLVLTPKWRMVGDISNCVNAESQLAILQYSTQKIQLEVFYGNKWPKRSKNSILLELLSKKALSTIFRILLLEGMIVPFWEFAKRKLDDSGRIPETPVFDKNFISFCVMPSEFRNENITVCNNELVFHFFGHELSYKVLFVGNNRVH